MSIKADINELNQVNAEIKRLGDLGRTLKKQAKVIESRILEYLQSKEQPGVKFNDTAIIVENKVKRGSKKTAERENDAIRILEDNGIDNAKQVLNQILEARKGDEEEIKKIKIKKIK